MTTRPSFKGIKIFNEGLVVVEYIKPAILMNKPVYTGFTTLDVSKVLMYDFHYNVVLPKYGNNIRLLFTDTDSLCYHIKTEDLYQDMEDMQEYFDTSNYPKEHPLFSMENAKSLAK